MVIQNHESVICGNEIHTKLGDLWSVIECGHSKVTGTAEQGNH